MDNIEKFERRPEPILQVQDHSFVTDLVVGSLLRTLVYRGTLAESDVLDIIEGIAAGLADAGASPGQLEAARSMVRRYRRALGF